MDELTEPMALTEDSHSVQMISTVVGVWCWKTHLLPTGKCKNKLIDVMLTQRKLWGPLFLVLCRKFLPWVQPIPTSHSPPLIIAFRGPFLISLPLSSARITSSHERRNEWLMESWVIPFFRPLFCFVFNINHSPQSYIHKYRAKLERDIEYDTSIREGEGERD